MNLEPMIEIWLNLLDGISESRFQENSQGRNHNCSRKVFMLLVFKNSLQLIVTANEDYCLYHDCSNIKYI